VLGMRLMANGSITDRRVLREWLHAHLSTRSCPAGRMISLGAREVEQLPEKAKAYIKVIEDITGVPVSVISVGPGRDETIIVKYPS